MNWWHWLIVHLSQESGTSNEASRAYAFWSGFGSDIGEVVIIGGLIQFARHANCHTKGCWRLARHQVEGTPYKTCRHHHPTINKAPTMEEIYAAHRAARSPEPCAPDKDTVENADSIS